MTWARNSESRQTRQLKKLPSELYIFLARIFPIFSVCQESAFFNISTSSGQFHQDLSVRTRKFWFSPFGKQTNLMHANKYVEMLCVSIIDGTEIVWNAKEYLNRLTSNYFASVMFYRFVE